MQLATVPLEALTQRVNRLLQKDYSPTYISGVRNGNTGSAALRHIVRTETAAMLQEAADAAKAQAQETPTP
jgi:hypothetical protein